MNACTKFRGNLWNTCQDISITTTWSGARGQTQQIEVIIICKCRCNPFKKGWENSAFFKNGGPIYWGTSIEIPTATQLVCLRDAHLFSSIKMIVLFCSGWVEIIQGRYVFVRSLWYLVKHTVKAQHLWYEIIASINPDSTSDWHVKPNTVSQQQSPKPFIHDLKMTPLPWQEPIFYIRAQFFLGLYHGQWPDSLIFLDPMWLTWLYK